MTAKNNESSAEYQSRQEALHADIADHTKTIEDQRVLADVVKEEHWNNVRTL